MNIQAIEKYVIQRFNDELKPIYVYHTLNHTLDVVNAAGTIAKYENLNEKEILLVKTAAFFHDIGIIVDFKEHEKHSINIAKSILPENGYSNQDIEIITNIIYSTQMPQVANNIFQKIICDADLDYLGRDDYFKISSLLRTEWFHLFKQDFSDIQWYISQAKFLSNHNYFTNISKKLRNEKKMLNIIKIQEIINNLI